MNETIRHLEEKIAYLEHHVTEQDKVMLELADDLARLRKELKLLAGRISGGSGESEEDLPEQERPPHY